MNTLVIALSAFLGQPGDAPAASVQPATTPAPMVVQEQRRGLLGRRTTTTSTTATTTSGQRRMGVVRNSERTPIFQGRLLGRNRY